MKPPKPTTDVEVSVAMPCLNEEMTLGTCIEKVQQTLKALGIKGEIIVADNGSTDGSVEIAESLGAKVVHQPIRGYGAAYLAGIAAAQGKYIIIGDSDDTYDFTDLERFIEPLRNGYDLVMGSRFKGEILPGAMSWSHRYIGNPILSGILRWFFKTNISDSHCGMRGFTREAYERMALQTTGMEFASEMVVKAVQEDLKIHEVPITYYPREGESKLNSFRDAWRHLRFMLLLSPTYLFVLPGSLLFVLGLLVLLVMLPGPVQIGNHAYDIHVMTLVRLCRTAWLSDFEYGALCSGVCRCRPVCAERCDDKPFVSTLHTGTRHRFGRSVVPVWRCHRSPRSVGVDTE